MADPSRARSIFEVGGCEVDLGRRELRTDGVPTPIGDRAFEIIEALVRADGRLVTKNELMDLVWPGTIVGDNTLQVHISAVRKALGARRGMLKTEAGRGVEPHRYARAACPARRGKAGSRPGLRALRAGILDRGPGGCKSAARYAQLMRA